MLTHRPAIDWLTLTTFYTRFALEADALLHSFLGDVETKPHNVMQYNGRLGDGFFIGEAEQNGKAHYMLRLSGDLSDRFMFHPLKPSLECSRIDLQLTLPFIDDGYEVFKTSEKEITEHEKGKGQRARKVNTILSGDGFCTMYIGHRSSDRFYRIYVKEHSGDMFLRFEVEIKGKEGMSGRIYRETTKNPDKMGEYLAGELSTLPDDPIVNMFREHLKRLKPDLLKQTRQRSDPSTTLSWLARQCVPAWERMIGNEDTRDRAVMMLYELYEFWRKLDER
jgi:hypothetical protein